MDFLPHLLTLGNPSSDRRTRDHSSRALLEALQGEAAVHATKFRNLLHSHQDLEDAYVHVVVRASRGTQRFRGEHGEASARSWVHRVLRNTLIDNDRKRKRLARASEKLEREFVDAQLRQGEDERRRIEAHELVARVTSLVRMRLSRERNGSERLRKIQIGVDAVWRPEESTRRQLVAFGYVADEDLDVPATFKAARARLYQDRRRGRVDLAQVIGKMVRSGDLDDETAAAFCAASLVPWPPPGPLPEIA